MSPSCEVQNLSSDKRQAAAPHQPSCTAGDPTVAFCKYAKRLSVLGWKWAEEEESSSFSGCLRLGSGSALRH